jgi:RNA polymerase sigma-70 factor, ECF subfamily
LGAFQRLLPKDLVIRLTEVNGDPGIVSYLNGKPYSVLTIDVSEDRIHAVYVVTNPEKLSRIPPLPANSE